MWWLLLVLGVIAVSADDYESYGCKFENSYKLVAVNNEDPSNLEEFRRLKFGERMPRIMFNHNDYQNFMSKIREVYKNTMETFVFTDIPQFNDFYDKYYAESSFEEIYKHFSFDFQRKSVSSYSFAIKLIEELSKNKYKNINLADHICLVAVYENKQYPENFIKKKEHHINDYIISHVAVLIRMAYVGSPGVILMDMGYKSFGPTTLELSHPSTTDDLSRWELKWDSTKDFITVDESPSPTRYPNIYYIAKPYCSFATTTFKRQLLANTTKSLIRRDRRGDPTVSISFDVTEANPKFTMTTYEYGNGRWNRECRQETIVVKFHELDSMNEKQKVHYNKVLSKFKIPNPADAEKKSDIDENSVRDFLDRAVKISANKKFIKDYKNFLPNLLKLRGQNRKMSDEEIGYVHRG